MGEAGLELGLERLEQRAGIGDRPARRPVVRRSFEEVGGRADADVGPEQGLLEVVPRLLVDLGPGQDRTHVAGHDRAGLGQPLPERRPWCDDLGLDGASDRRQPRARRRAGPPRLARRACRHHPALCPPRLGRDETVEASARDASLGGSSQAPASTGPGRDERRPDDHEQGQGDDEQGGSMAPASVAAVLLAFPGHAGRGLRSSAWRLRRWTVTATRSTPLPDLHRCSALASPP